VEIARRVGLHPFGHVVLAAVFPGAEPEQIEPDVVLARLSDDGIDDRVVELSRLWFELFPVDRYLQRIGVQGFDGRPNFRKHGRPAAGIMRLGAQHEVRRAVHHKGVAPVFLDYLGDGTLLDLGVQRDGNAAGRQ